MHHIPRFLPPPRCDRAGAVGGREWDVVVRERGSVAGRPQDPPDRARGARRGQGRGRGVRRLARAAVGGRALGRRQLQRGVPAGGPAPQPPPTRRTASLRLRQGAILLVAARGRRDLRHGRRCRLLRGGRLPGPGAAPGAPGGPGTRGSGAAHGGRRGRHRGARCGPRGRRHRPAHAHRAGGVGGVRLAGDRGPAGAGCRAWTASAWRRSWCASNGPSPARSRRPTRSSWTSPTAPRTRHRRAPPRRGNAAGP